DACLALPTAQIAVMGPEAAVNAVYANKIASLSEDERQNFIKEKHEAYKEDIDIYRLASEMVVDDIVHPDDLRDELVKRFSIYESKNITFTNVNTGSILSNAYRVCIGLYKMKVTALIF